MNAAIALLSLFGLAVVCPLGRAQDAPPTIMPALQMKRLHNEITFVSPNTFCHQGYATDGTNHFTFDNQAIYLWSNDVSWTSLASNTSVFSGFHGLQHLGDGDYYNGMLYVVAEWWSGCGAYTNQSIVTFDATTLQRLHVYNVARDAHEMSGLAVVPGDGTNGIIYVTSYCDGSQIWEYDLSTFTLIGTLPLSQTIPYLQGIAAGNGKFYLSQDSGNIYSVDYNGNVTPAFSTRIPGSHEGLKFVQGQIRWLIDGGLGHKFIYYVNLDSLLVSIPPSAAGWILEESAGIGQPWIPVPIGQSSANADGSLSVSLAPPTGNMFYHLRQP